MIFQSISLSSQTTSLCSRTSPMTSKTASSFASTSPLSQLNQGSSLSCTTSMVAVSASGPRMADVPQLLHPPCVLPWHSGVSRDHRLVPEHQLLAAIENVYGKLMWLRDVAVAEDSCRDVVEWLDGAAAFNRVFLLGESSGGNIAHHLAVRMGIKLSELHPVHVCGYVLLGPSFGEVARTKSEEGPSEAMLNLDILDRFWRLSLPPGESRDHPLANPFGPASPRLEPLSLVPFLVMVGGNELLKDRVVKRMREMGKDVEYKGKEHGFFTNEPYSEMGSSHTCCGEVHA